MLCMPPQMASVGIWFRMANRTKSNSKLERRSATIGKVYRFAFSVQGWIQVRSAACQEESVDSFQQAPACGPVPPQVAESPARRRVPQWRGHTGPAKNMWAPCRPILDDHRH
jgi:hypothetical protein